MNYIIPKNELSALLAAYTKLMLLEAHGQAITQEQHENIMIPYLSSYFSAEEIKQGKGFEDLAKIWLDEKFRRVIPRDDDEGDYY